MSKLENFIKALNQGTITDFTSYIEGSPTSFREAMAERGIEVDALVAKNEPAVISMLIAKGYASEHYETWKTHKDIMDTRKNTTQNGRNTPRIMFEIV